MAVLGDGAEWIWQRAVAFLGSGGREVVEMGDIYHAYGYPRDAGTALFGAGTAEAVGWVERLKGRLYE